MTVGTFPTLPLATNPSAVAAAVEFNGGILNSGAVGSLIQSMLNNSSPAAGNNSALITSAAATVTLTALGGVTYRLTNGGAVVVTLDNAVNIVNALNGPTLGMTFPLQILASGATTVATPTVTNTGVSLAGTTAVVAGSCRWYQGQITQITTNAVTGVTAGTTFTSLTQIGTSNLYTLALGTNAITSIVGNLIYIGTTAGTLPPGFYPTYSAGTTSIVIAAGAPGLTATAATMVAPTVVPQVLAPLIALTGVMATVTATMTV